MVKMENCRPYNAKIGKFISQVEILNLLNNGLYINQIHQSLNFPLSKLHRIIKDLEKNKYITQKPRKKKIPKYYKLMSKGEILLKIDNFSKNDHSKDLNEKLEEKVRSKDVRKIREHKLRFMNELSYRPSWLNRINNMGRYEVFMIKRVRMKNWDKFLLLFNYQDFNGLEKIEVNIHSIVYNFNLNKKDQYIYENQSIQDYEDRKREDCKRARAFLQEKGGFIIDESDPIFLQKPSYAIESKGDPNHIGSLGKHLNLVVKHDNETYEIDDSGKNGGEEETNNVEKAQSYLDLSMNIANMNKSIVKMENAISQIALNQTRLIKLLTPPGNQNDKFDNSKGLYQ